VRWRDGEVWFVDTPHLKAISTEGEVRSVAELPAKLVLGLTFDAKGNAYFGDSLARRIHRVDPDGNVEVAADLSEVFPFPTNEVLATSDGTLYVGSMGFDILNHGAPAHSRLARVTPEGEISLVGAEVLFPNGMALGPDGTTLLVAESFAGKITEFRIADDGDLVDARTFADVSGADANHPDGIAIDPAGGVWYADPMKGVVVLVADGGEELRRVSVPIKHPTSVGVGGKDSDLLLVTATPAMANAEFKFAGGAALFELPRKP
jgi:sugar lactone lactonase YvrE